MTKVLKHTLLNFAMIGCFLSTSIHAEVAYISDNLSIELRSGPSIKYRIKHFLKSGQQVDILERHTDEENNKTWSLVKSQSKTGWLESRFLQSNVSVKIETQRLTKQLSEQTKELDELNDLKQRHQDTLNRLQSLKQSYDELKRTSERSTELNQENQDMRSQLELLKSKQEELKVNNSQLRDDNRAEGITQGLLAVLCGVIIALIVPRLASRKPRSSWD